MVDSRHSCGGYGSAGEQPERRHEAEDWAERRSLCSLLPAQFLAESDKLKGQSILVCAIGMGLWDGFAVQVTAILSPGVVGSRRLGGPDLTIQGFGIHDFGLADGFMVNSVGQRFVLVEDGDFSLEILADGDFRIP